MPWGWLFNLLVKHNLAKRDNSVGVTCCFCASRVVRVTVTPGQPLRIDLCDKTASVLCRGFTVDFH